MPAQTCSGRGQGLHTCTAPSISKGSANDTSSCTPCANDWPEVLLPRPCRLAPGGQGARCPLAEGGEVLSFKKDSDCNKLRPRTCSSHLTAARVAGKPTHTL